MSITNREKYLKKYFRSWKFYVDRKLYQQRNIHKAYFFNQFKTKQKILNILVLNVEIGKKAINNPVHIERSKELNRHEISLLRSYWNIWMNFYKQLKLLEQEQMDFSVLFHYEKTLRIVFHSWEEFCNKKIKERDLSKQALVHYTPKLLKYYFHKLIQFAMRRSEKRQMIELAEKYYSNELRKKTLSNWIKYHRQKIEYSHKIKFVNDRMNFSVRKKIITCWKAYIFHRKCSERKKKTSDHHYKKRIMCKHFIILKHYLQYRKAKRHNFIYLQSRVQRIIHRYEIIYINKWRVAMICAVRERQKLFFAVEHWEISIKKKLFKRWEIFRDEHRAKSKYKNYLDQISSHSLLRQYIIKWSLKFQECKSKECKLRQVFEFRIIRRIFKSWRQYSLEKSRKRTLEMGRGLREKLRYSEAIILPKKSHFIIPEFMKNDESNDLSRIFKEDYLEPRINYQDRKLERKLTKIDLLPPSAFYR